MAPFILSVRPLPDSQLDSDTLARRGVPALAAPTAVTDLNLTVVSTTELGVYWRKPDFNGGAPLTKYLVEWDKTSAMARSEATYGAAYADAAHWSNY